MTTLTDFGPLYSTDHSRLAALAALMIAPPVDSGYGVEQISDLVRCEDMTLCLALDTTSGLYGVWDTRGVTWRSSLGALTDAALHLDLLLCSRPASCSLDLLRAHAARANA